MSTVIRAHDARLGSVAAPGAEPGELGLTVSADEGTALVVVGTLADLHAFARRVMREVLMTAAVGLPHPDGGA